MRGSNNTSAQNLTRQQLYCCNKLKESLLCSIRTSVKIFVNCYFCHKCQICTIVYQLPFTTIIMISNHPYVLLTDFLLSMTVPNWRDYSQWIKTTMVKREMERREFYRYCNLKVRDHRWSRCTPFVIIHFNALFSNFRDWFRQIGKTACVWQVGFPHSPAIWQITVCWDKLCSVTPADSCFYSLWGYCTFSLLIFRKVFEPNRRVTVGRDPMFVTVL